MTKGWADSVECYCHLRNIQDLLSDGKTPYERRFGIQFNGQVIPFGAMVDYHPISAKDLSRLHQFGPQVLPGIFLGYVLSAVRIWKGDIMVADIEELEEMDASELHARRINAKEVLTPMKGENFIFPVADGKSQKISGEDQVLRTSTLIRDRPERGEEQNNLRGESDGSSATLRQDSSWYDGEAKSDFWSISGDFIYRHHVEPRVKLYVPTEESFPVPLKYNVVTRTTDTTLDVMSEKHIDDYWNVHGNRELSDAWTGSTRFIVLNEKPPGGFSWSGERQTRKQTTARLDSQICGSICLMHRNAKKSKNWATEKPKLDNARRLRGIFITELDDEEFKRFMKSARRKLEIPMPAAMPRWLQLYQHRETCGTVGQHNTKDACVVEADEQMRIRMEGSQSKNRQDHIAGKVMNSLSRYKLVHKFIPMLEAMKIPDAKVAVDKEWENSRKYRHGSGQESKTKVR